jgi:hypothetical protein
MSRFVALATPAIALLWGGLCLAADLRLGPAQVTKTLRSGKQVHVTVVVGLQEQTALWANRMWGSEEAFPVTRHVTDLRIVWADSVVWIPLSAYSDLGQPESVEFVKATNGVSFSVRGGETATGYEAQFFLDRGVLVRRRVRSSEMPEFSEETKYSGPVQSN